MATKQEIKKLIDSLASAVDNIGSLVGVEEVSGKAVKLEMAMFMMYLSASDGEIGWSEASMISDLCEVNLTPQNVGKIIRENNIYSTEFESRVPITLKIVITMDNKLLEMGMGDDLPDVPTVVVDTYKAVAETLINADGDADDSEQTDCHIYLDMLEDYVNNNSVRRKASVSGFKKNSGSVSAPTKSGVSAPKKKG